MSDDRSPLLRSPPEVLMLYLVTLDPKSLQAACRSSKEFNNVCQDDYFWYQKVLHDYGEMDKRNTWKRTWMNVRKYKFVYDYELYNYDKAEADRDIDYEWTGYPPSYNRIITKTEVEYLTNFLSDLLYASNGDYILDEVVIDSNNHLITFIILENPSDDYASPSTIADKLDVYFKEWTKYTIDVSLLPLNSGEEFDGIYPVNLRYYDLIHNVNKGAHVI